MRMKYPIEQVSNLLKGAATLLPTILTLWVFLSVYAFIDNKIATPIADLIKGRLVQTESGNAAASR